MECRQLVLAVFQANTKRNLVTEREEFPTQIKQGSYKNLTIGSYDIQMNHVTMAQKNNETN